MPPSTSILIAAPTSADKDYSYWRWRDAVSNQEYPEDWRVGCLVVDNTPNDEYWRTIGSAFVGVKHIEPTGEGTISEVNQSWGWILSAAWKWGYKYIFSVETDVIIPPDAMRIMVEMAETHGAKTIGHSYPQRSDNPFLIVALGCTLLEARFFPPEEVRPTNWHFEGWIFQKPRIMGEKVLWLDNFFKTEHLCDSTKP